MNAPTRVWIADGCILCQHCTGVAPDVFVMPGDSALIAGAVRVDGTTSRNADERSPLNAVGLEYEDAIREAAAGCPIEIIHLDDA